MGMLDDDWLLLFPEATYQFVAAASRSAGSVFPIELKTLLARLDESGLIATESSAKRRTVNIWTGSGTKRVIKLRRDAVMPHASCIREFGEFGEGDSESDPYQHTYPFPSAGASSMNGTGQGRGPGTILSAIPVIPFIPSVSAIEDQLSDAEHPYLRS